MTHGELNRLAVLSAINETPNHGYALHDQLKKESFYKIAAPTLYLLLRTMEDEGVIESFGTCLKKEQELDAFITSLQQV